MNCFSILFGDRIASLLKRKIKPFTQNYLQVRAEYRVHRKKTVVLNNICRVSCLPSFASFLQALNQRSQTIKKFTFLLLVAVLVGFVSLAYAQETISPEDASRFIGQQKTVCGMVASTHFAAKSRKQPTFINLGRPYPNQVFTVLIWGSDRSKFETPPEMLYSEREICVTGMIQSYNGRPEIFVKEPAQIKVR